METGVYTLFVATMETKEVQSMTDTVELKKRIEESGLKIEFLASKIGITRAALSMKLNNKSPFKVAEMYKLRELIKLNEIEAKKIFFNQNVAKKDTN